MKFRDSMNIDPTTIREFLQEFFSDKELVDFCIDYFPKVSDEFAKGMTINQKVLLLIDYCQQQSQIDRLLAALNREHPTAFSEYFLTLPPTLQRYIKPQKSVERNIHQVFISHSQKDAQFAQRLGEDLKAQGWVVWIAPDSIHPGEKWVEAINRGLMESGVFVLLLSEQAIKSHWVQTETNIAVEMQHQDKLQFIPLRIERIVSPDAIPPIWRSYQEINFQEDYDTGLKSLYRELELQEKIRLKKRYEHVLDAIRSNNWDEVVRIGSQINETDPKFQEVVNLLVPVRRESQREKTLLARLFAQLQTNLRTIKNVSLVGQGIALSLCIVVSIFAIFIANNLIGGNTPFQLTETTPTDNITKVSAIQQSEDELNPDDTLKDNLTKTTFPMQSSTKTPDAETISDLLTENETGTAEQRGEDFIKTSTPIISNLATPTITYTQSQLVLTNPSPSLPENSESHLCILYTDKNQGASSGYDIFIVNFDGSQVVNLTNSDWDEGSPSTSPDGKQIVFDVDRDDNREIYVLDLDDMQTKNLSQNSGYDVEPIWSPDGKKIAFSSNRGETDIFVMDSDGSRQFNLTNSYNWDSTPIWSPDSSKIAFLSDKGLERGVWVMDADGADQVPITENDTRETGSSRNYTYTWAPDSQRIAVTMNIDGKNDIYVVEIDDTGIIGLDRLTDDSTTEGNLSWSPNSEWIAFSKEVEGMYDIYLINATTKDVSRLTHDDDGEWDFKWSLDGYYLAFAKNSSIYYINLETNERIRLTDSLEYLYQRSFSWYPSCNELFSNRE